VTAHIVGVENRPAFNRVHTEAFGSAKPARTVVPVAELRHGYLVEIEAIGARKSFE
jgi:2-iminobutanoate/2-iminopropanoate deaminase